MNLKKWTGFLNNALWVINPFLTLIAFFSEKLKLGIYLEWFGKMHPLFLHFPIVLGILIGIYYLVDKKGSVGSHTLHPILVGNAFLASIVAILGIFLSKQDSYDDSLIFAHQWGGIAIAMIGWALIYLQQYNQRFKSNYINRVQFSMVYLLVIIIFTHKGAQLTHGASVISFPQKEAAENTQVIKVVTDSNATLYARAVAPILQQKCVSCHGAEKVKGELLLNTPENILKGGKDGDILTADNNKEAMLFERIHLDITHKKHMPPDGKVQLTKEEVAILSRWIKAGGDFKMKMNELAKTDTLFLLANKYTPADNTKVEVKTGLPDLAAYNSNYCTVNYLYHGSDAIDVNFFQGNFYSRDVLKKLEKLQDQVLRLNMQGMPLTNEDVSIISQFNNVEVVNLNYTNLDLKTLEPLKQLKKLKLLSICGLKFNETDLTNFLKGSNIANINIWSSIIGKAQLEKLAARYPKTKFTIGDNMESEVLKINPPTIDQDSSIITKFLDVKMKHMLNGVTIRYTLNGVDPDSLTSPIYKNTLRLTRNTNLKIKVFKPGWIGSDIIQRNFYKSEIHPDSIYLISSPDQKYLGEGAKTLVDLELGGNNFTNKKWLGYKDTTMKFMVNFNQPRVLHQAFLNSLIDVGSYVFPIVSISVEGSNDGIKFSKITETKFPYELTQKDVMKDIKTFTVDFPNNTSYKHYRFTVLNVKKLPIWHPGKGTTAWIFVDELFLN